MISIINVPLSLWPTPEEQEVGQRLVYVLSCVNGREAKGNQSDWRSAVVRHLAWYGLKVGPQHTRSEYRM